MNDETEIDPGYIDGPTQDQLIQSTIDDCNTTYGILDELIFQLVEACEENETEYREEIDRQNLRKLMDDIDLVQRVKLLVEEIVEGKSHGNS